MHVVVEAAFEGGMSTGMRAGIRDGSAYMTSTSSTVVSYDSTCLIVRTTVRISKRSVKQVQVSMMLFTNAPRKGFAIYIFTSRLCDVCDDCHSHPFHVMCPTGSSVPSHATQSLHVLRNEQ